MNPRQTAFPFYCFPPMAQGSGWELTNNVGMPTEIAGTTILSSMAASIQGCFDVEPAPGMRIPLSLMTFVVAPSGTGKTVAENRLTSGIKKFEEEMREKFDGDWIQYQSATDAHTAERKAILGLLREQMKAGKDTAYQAISNAYCLGPISRRSTKAIRSFKERIVTSMAKADFCMQIRSDSAAQTFGMVRHEPAGKDRTNELTS